MADNCQKNDTDKEKSFFDIILLDIMMPEINGIEVCKLIRSHFAYRSYIIMLTALGSTEDIVAGLDSGADDYVVKPFKFTELLARVNSLLRRKANNEASFLACGDLKLYPNGTCERQGKKIYLSDKEFRPLEYMLKNQDRTVTKKEILSAVWDKDFDPNTNIGEVYIRYLRQKTDDGFGQKLIHTELGKGYRLYLKV